MMVSSRATRHATDAGIRTSESIPKATCRPAQSSLWLAKPQRVTSRDWSGDMRADIRHPLPVCSEALTPCDCWLLALARRLPQSLGIEARMDARCGGLDNEFDQWAGQHGRQRDRQDTHRDPEEIPGDWSAQTARSADQSRRLRAATPTHRLTSRRQSPRPTPSTSLRRSDREALNGEE